MILQFYSTAHATLDNASCCEIKELGLFFVIIDNNYKIGDFTLVKDHGIFALSYPNLK